MKKLFVILVSVIVAVFCVFGFAACDSSTNTVDATCIFDYDTMRLPAKFEKAYQGGSYIYFIPKESCSLEGLQTDVAAMTGKGITYSAEIYNEDCLLIEKSNGTEIHYYLTIRTDLYYYFLSPIKWCSAESGCILFPYHLTYLTDADFEGYFHDDIEFDKHYYISGTREQIKEFYAKVNLFDISEEGDTLIIKLKEDYELPERKYFGNYHHLQKAFTITFGEDEEGKYAVYAYAEEQSE